MAKILPFQELEDILHNHRTVLINTMTDQYMIAKANRSDPGSKYNQTEIYRKYCEKITDPEMERFKSIFYNVHIQRDASLGRYAASVVDFIRNLGGNEDLVESYFLETEIKDRVTNDKYTTLKQVSGYRNDRHISTLLKERPDDILPIITRPSGVVVPAHELEIMSISNLVGFSSIEIQAPDYGDFKYYVAARLKNSERELNKLVDWLLDLRSKEDYPYDSMGLRIITPDNDNRCRTNWEKMYDCVDFIYKLTGKYGKVLSFNTQTHEENLEVSIKRLEPKNLAKREEEGKKAVVKKLEETYTIDNMREVLSQMRAADALLIKRDYKSKGNLTKDQKAVFSALREALLQYRQFKHFFENDRVETQIMTKEMHRFYTGEHVGHTSDYLRRRDKEREDYLKDPSKSYARKDVEKREERTTRNKKRFPTKQQYLEETSEDSSKNPQSEPDISFLAELLSNRYRCAISRPEFRIF